MPGVFDYNNRTLGEFACNHCQNSFQTRDHEIRRCIPQTEKNDTDDRASAEGQDFAKIQVKRQDNPLLLNRELKNFIVGQSLKAFFSEMDRVESLAAQPI